MRCASLAWVSELTGVAMADGAGWGGGGGGGGRLLGGANNSMREK